MNSARKHLLFSLLILVTLALMIPAVSLAAEFDASVQLSPDKVTAVGETVSVSVTVENVSCDTEDPVSLCDADGNPIEAFGEGGYALLSRGEMSTASFTCPVTEEDISNGQKVFYLKYTKVVDGEVQHFEQKLSAPVAFDGTVVSLKVTRSVTPEVVRKGATATVSYELYNNGTVEISNIKVQETVIKTAQTVKTLAPGQKTTLTFTARMGSESLSSSAVIQYKANGEAGEQSVPALEIPLASPNLSMSASCPSGGVNIGEAAEIQITFENNGNITYSDVSVSDEKAGTLLTGLEIPANRTISYTVPVQMTEPVTFHLRADLHDNTGTTSSVNAPALTVNAYDPEKSIRLNMVLTSDEDTVSQLPATVSFRLVITNDSNVTAKNISITQRDTKIATVNSLEPGQSQTLIRNVRLSAAGSFRFTASCSDSLGNSVTFDSNTLKITKVNAVVTAAPTMIPLPAQPTQVPAVDNLSRMEQIRGILVKVFNVMIYVVLALAALLLVALIVRLIKRVSSNSAYDHLELSEHRDYKVPASEEEHKKKEIAPVKEKEPENGSERKHASRNDDVDLEDDSLTIGAAPRKKDSGENRVVHDPAPASDQGKAESKAEAPKDREAASPVIKPISTRSFPAAAPAEEKKAEHSSFEFKSASPKARYRNSDSSDSKVQGGRHAVQSTSGINEEE